MVKNEKSRRRAEAGHGRKRGYLSTSIADGGGEGARAKSSRHAKKGTSASRSENTGAGKEVSRSTGLSSKPIQKRGWFPPLRRGPTLDDRIEHILTEKILNDCERRLKLYASRLGSKGVLQSQTPRSVTRSQRSKQKEEDGVEEGNAEQKGLTLKLRLKKPEEKSSQDSVEPTRIPRQAKANDASQPTKRRSRRQVDVNDEERPGNEDGFVEIPSKPRSTPKQPVVSKRKPPSVPKQLSAKRVDSALHIPKKSQTQDSERRLSQRRRSSKSDDDVEVRDSTPEDSKTPLESILDFARGVTSALAKTDNLDKKQTTKKRLSVATFIDCEEFSGVSLSLYIQALASIHLGNVKAVRQEGPKSDSLRDGLNGLVCEFSHEDIVNKLGIGETRTPKRKRQRNPCPPGIPKLVDVLQLALRSWQRMASSGAEEGIMKGFMNSWYASDLSTSVPKLAVESLLLCKECSSEEDSSSNTDRDEPPLGELAIRLLAAILVFELSPTSVITELPKIKPSSLFSQALAKEQPLKLSDIMDSCLDYVSSERLSPSRECRQAVGELGQVYVVRHHCTWDEESPQRVIWDDIVRNGDKHLHDLLVRKQFWSVVVHSAISTTRKHYQTAEGCLAIAFLVSLLSRPSSLRSLLQKQTKHRDDLLKILVQFLQRIGRGPIACFADVEEDRRAYPGLPSMIDLIRKLMSFAVLQRELVSSGELGLKQDYLEAIRSILVAAAKLVQGTLDSEVVMKYAQDGKFGSMKVELLVEAKQKKRRREHSRDFTTSSSDQDEDEESAKDRAIARHKAVAFGAWLIGSLGKSMEDGSRDMSQMNGLQVLLSSEFNNNRLLKSFWTMLLTIQMGVERRIPAELSEGSPGRESNLLADFDRNCFSMVVEAVRLRVVSDQNDRNSRDTYEESAKESSPGPERKVVEKGKSKIVFPNIAKVPDLRWAVCTDQGYYDFDNDPTVLKVIEEQLTSRGKQVLARYDSQSDHVTTWIRLQKRNAYIDGARDLLEKEDRVLGHPCSCLPGNPSSDQRGTRSQIACSNDLCENRSAKVECVPGECGAGIYCQNQRMQKLEYAKTKMVSFPGKGVGVVADEDIPAGAFIGEYQGEVISNEMFEERKQEYEGERHFYFMTLTSKLVIDASRKSQHTRFVNHSCEPNAETQKWNAGGEPRVGIFAAQDIAKGVEITFDYGARSLANDSIPCLCGAKSCRGFLTVAKESEDVGVDHSGLANTKNMAKDESNASEASRRRTPKDQIGGRKSNEGKEDLNDDVQQKIEWAKKNLKMAETIRIQRKELPAPRRMFNPSVMTEEMKRKLNKWDEAMKKLIAKREKPSTFSVDGSAAGSVPVVRIPRRAKDKPGHSNRAQESILKTFASQLEARTATAKKAQPAPPKRAPTKRVEPADVYKQVTGAYNFPPAPRQPWRTASQRANEKAPDSSRDLHRSDAQRRASSGIEIVEVTRPRFEGVKQDRRSLPSESIQGPRKVPRGSFLPTSSKVKKPRRAPKFASRPKPKRDTSDDDSMDEYSTASSAEAVEDEPPLLSPGRLPDGSGACSDDEFVAAPPISEVIQHEEELGPQSQNPRFTGYRERPRQTHNVAQEDTKSRAFEMSEGSDARRRGEARHRYDFQVRDNYRRPAYSHGERRSRAEVDDRHDNPDNKMAHHGTHHGHGYGNRSVERHEDKFRRASSVPDLARRGADVSRGAAVRGQPVTNDDIRERESGTQSAKDRQEAQYRQGPTERLTREGESDRHRHPPDSQVAKNRIPSPRREHNSNPAGDLQAKENRKSLSPTLHGERHDVLKTHPHPVREGRQARGMSFIGDGEPTHRRHSGPLNLDKDRDGPGSGPAHGFASRGEREYKYTRPAGFVPQSRSQEDHYRNPGPAHFHRSRDNFRRDDRGPHGFYRDRPQNRSHDWPQDRQRQWTQERPQERPYERKWTRTRTTPRSRDLEEVAIKDVHASQPPGAHQYEQKEDGGTREPRARTQHSNSTPPMERERSRDEPRKSLSPTKREPNASQLDHGRPTGLGGDASLPTKGTGLAGRRSNEDGALSDKRVDDAPSRKSADPLRPSRERDLALRSKPSDVAESKRAPTTQVAEAQNAFEGLREGQSQKPSEMVERKGPIQNVSDQSREGPRWQSSSSKQGAGKAPSDVPREEFRRKGSNATAATNVEAKEGNPRQSEFSQKHTVEVKPSTPQKSAGRSQVEHNGSTKRQAIERPRPTVKDVVSKEAKQPFAANGVGAERGKVDDRRPKLSSAPAAPLQRSEKTAGVAERGMKRRLSPVKDKNNGNEGRVNQNKEQSVFERIGKRFKEGSREEVREGTRDGFREGHREGYREGHREGNREGPREGFREGPREGFREGFREGPREGFREGFREGGRNGPRGGTREGGREGFRDGFRDGRKYQNGPPHKGGTGGGQGGRTGSRFSDDRASAGLSRRGSLKRSGGEDLRKMLKKRRSN